MESEVCKSALKGQSLVHVLPVTVSFLELSDAHCCAVYQGTKDCLCMLPLKPFSSLCTITFRARCVPQWKRGAGDMQTQRDFVILCVTAQGREFLLVILMSGLIPPSAVPCLFGTQPPALLGSCSMFYSWAQPLAWCRWQLCRSGAVSYSRTPPILENRKVTSNGDGGLVVLCLHCVSTVLGRGVQLWEPQTWEWERLPGTDSSVFSQFPYL